MTAVVSAPLTEAASLAGALRSLAAQGHRDLEVVVAPWGPGNPDAVHGVAAPARLAPHTVTGNAARNAGAAVATGADLIFLDQHTRLRPGALDLLTAAARANRGYRVVHAVGGRSPCHPSSYLFETGYWADNRLGFEETHGDFPDAVGARALAARPVRVEGLTWERVARTGAASGVMPSWSDSIDAWLTMVPAVRQMVHGREKAMWIRGLVLNDVPGLLADIERLPPIRMPDLADTIGTLLAALPADDLSRLPVETRAAAWLGGQAHWSELADFLAGRLQNEGHFPTRIEGARVYAELPGVAWEDLRVPQPMLEVGPAETRMTCSVGKVRWLQEGAGVSLAVDVLVGVRHVPLSRPRIQARWVSRGRTIPATVQPGPGAATVTTPLTALPVGTWRLEVAITQGRLVRTGRADVRDPDGSAGELRPAPDGSALPVWDAEGLRLVVAGPHSFVREALSAPRATEVRHESGWLVVDTTGPVTGAPVLRTRNGELRGRVDGSSLRFRLRADPFGAGEGPAPAGHYRLEVDGRPVSWEAAAAVDVASDVTTDAHRVGVHRSPQGMVVLTLRPPLRDDELGAVAQQRLLASHDGVGGLVDQVLLESSAGRACTGNPLAIDGELARSRPGLTRLWSVDHATAVPAGARAVLRHTREWYAALATSRWVVVDGELPPFFQRRDGQRVVQTLTGHPSRTMGVEEWEGLDHSPRRIRHLLERTAGQWTALVVPSPRLESQFRGCFRYDGEVLALGLPSNDLLVAPDAESRGEATRNRLGIDEDQTVVLYAPEPGAQPAGNGRLHEGLDLGDLCARLGSRYTLLVHDASPPVEPVSGARLVDVTGHPGITELMLASDAALLDYSSLRFDYALIGRPMVFHVPDPRVRNGDARGFLFPYLKTAPGPIGATSEEVAGHLRDLDLVSRRYAPSLAAFNAAFNDMCDGHAAERVVAAIIGRRPGPESPPDAPAPNTRIVKSS